MEFPLLSFPALFVCLAFLFAGVVDSICGGGGLVTIPVMMASGIPTHYITGTNQASAMLGGFVSGWNYVKSGYYSKKAVLCAVPFGLVGSYLGSKLNLLVPEKALEIFMLAMIPVIAIFLFAKKDFGEVDRSSELSPTQSLLAAAVTGLLTGGYMGFYGPGGGLFMMLGFALFTKLDMLKASGTARIVGTISGLVSVLNYSSASGVIWNIALAAMVFNMAGSYIGSKLAIKKGMGIIRPVMLVVVVLLMIRVIYDKFM